MFIKEEKEKKMKELYIHFIHGDPFHITFEKIDKDNIKVIFDSEFEDRERKYYHARNVDEVLAKFFYNYKFGRIKCEIETNNKRRAYFFLGKKRNWIKKYK